MAQDIALTSTLTNGQFACPGDLVVFTCETWGSHAIAWISDQYIGEEGAQLEFAAQVDDVGSVRVSRFSGVNFAVLTGNNQTSNVLESKLHITTSPNDDPFALVTCIRVLMHSSW